MHVSSDVDKMNAPFSVTMLDDSDDNFQESWEELHHDSIIAELKMDTFGVAFQAAQILAATIRLVRDAISRQKDQHEVLQRALCEIEETKRIVDLVKDQEALQGSGALYAVLHRIQTIAESLTAHVKSMDKERGTLSAFTHQMIQGSTERDELAMMIRLLGRAKQDLTLHIQLVHVGLTMNAQKSIAVNIDLVENINRVVKGTLGKEKGLMIASFVQEQLVGGSSIESDGWLKLTSAQYKELQESQLGLPDVKAARLGVKHEPRRKERTIIDNFSVGSTQINAPITNGDPRDDAWADVDAIVIRGNVAKDGSLQANYPMTLTVWNEVSRLGPHRTKRTKLPY